MAWWDRIGDWVDLEAWKNLSRHVTAILGVMLSYALIGLLLDSLIPKGFYKTALETMEGYVLLGLFIWFMLQLAILLWKGRARG